MSKSPALVRGTLDLLILKIIALQPLNGWSISKRLRHISGDALHVSDGSLYPALHRLEHRRWLRAKWEVTDTGRRAKFYSLSRVGQRQLENEVANWERLSAAITQVIRLDERQHRPPQPASADDYPGAILRPRSKLRNHQ